MPKRSKHRGALDAAGPCVPLARFGRPVVRKTSHDRSVSRWRVRPPRDADETPAVCAFLKRSRGVRFAEAPGDFPSPGIRGHPRTGWPLEDTNPYKTLAKAFRFLLLVASVAGSGRHLMCSSRRRRSRRTAHVSAVSPLRWEGLGKTIQKIPAGQGKLSNKCF